MASGKQRDYILINAIFSKKSIFFKKNVAFFRKKACVNQKYIIFVA